MVELRPDGERVFLEERVGASGRWLPTADDLETLRGCEWVHAAGLHADPGVLARLAGSRMSLDMSGRPRTLLPVLAPHLELVFFSGDREGRDDALGLARAAVEHGAGAAVVTRGSEGSLAFDGRLVERSAEPAEVVDTLGAGDALIVAVITARLDGATLAEALDAGSRAAALACSHYGAWTPA
ncbi:MAG: PfkB family carbohydrate kinase [Gaiellales bacterium]